MAAGLLALTAVLPAADAQAQRSHPTAAETRQEFEHICRRLREGDNAFFGTRIVHDLRQRLQQGRDDPATQILIRARLGYELLRIDRVEEAIAELTSALESLDHAGGVSPEAERELISWLALAHFQLGEDQNCVADHSAESCILPLAPGAIHSRQEHARKAGDLFLVLLERYPDDLQTRWLLSLARMVTGEYPDGVPPQLRLPADVFEPEADFLAFRNIAPRLGIAVLDLSGGAIMDDFDGDGLLDLVSSSWDPCEPLKAFRNDGIGGFEEVSRVWGLDGQLGGLNLVHADYDNDGDLDVLVLRGAWLGSEGRLRNSLLRNDLQGDAGRFVDETAVAGLAHPAYPTQTAGWADYDGDGDLDLYVGSEAEASSPDRQTLHSWSGAAYPSQLFDNDGDGAFTDVSRSAGVANLGFAKGVAWGDYDDDGDPDLFVSNIGFNRLYRNRGDGTFHDVAAELGLAGDDARTFGTWFFDYDNDGDLDLWVNDYTAPIEEVTASYLGFEVAGGNPILYRNEGGRFTDVSRALGLTRPLLPMGANYGDADGDGWLDVYLGTGVPGFDALMPNVLYRNVRGRHFADVTFSSRLGHLQKGHGIAFGDYDRDGDQDLFQQLGGAYPRERYLNALYLNPQQGYRWIVLRLEGRRANRFALGARIRVDVVERGETRSVHALVGSGGSFGGSSLQQEIGLGEAESIVSVDVTWPGSGWRQRFTGVELDRYYLLVEGQED